MCRRSRGLDVFIKWKGRYNHFIFIKCLVRTFNMINFIGTLIYRKTFSAKSVFDLLESILQILGSGFILGFGRGFKILLGNDAKMLSQKL
jgi:hypothetical protein